MNKKYLFMLIMFISLLGCSRNGGTSPFDTSEFNVGNPKDLFPHLKDNNYMISYSKKAFDVAEKRLMENDPTTKQAFDEVVRKADEVLNDKLYAITHYAYPPRPSLHLYSSISRYSHPRPNEKYPDRIGTNSLCGTWHGLPWDGIDGVPNEQGAGGSSPTTASYAKTKMNTGLKYLALAYYFTKDMRYAEKAAAQIKMWFLNEDTYMIPDGSWAQCSPGSLAGWGDSLVWLDPDGNQYASNAIHNELKNNPNYVAENNLKAAYKGNNGGMIDVKEFTYAVDAALLIIDSGALSYADYRQLIDWFGAPEGTTRYNKMYSQGGMLSWLRDPDNRIEDTYDDQKDGNNQSVWLEVDYMTFSLFVGHVYPEQLRNIEQVRLPRLKTKMSRAFASDGAQPAEIVRPTSHNYCTYSLDAWAVAAANAKAYGDDSIWGDYGDGKTLKNGIKYMLRYAQNPDSWPFPDIHGSSQRRQRSIKFLAPAQYASGYDDMEGLYDITSTIMKENPLNEYNLVWPRVID